MFARDDRVKICHSQTLSEIRSYLQNHWLKSNFLDNFFFWMFKLHKNNDNTKILRNRPGHYSEHLKIKQASYFFFETENDLLCNLKRVYWRLEWMKYFLASLIKFKRVDFLLETETKINSSSVKGSDEVEIGTISCKSDI